MLKIITLFALLASTQASAANRKLGGTNYICNSADNLIKLTANLDDDPSERTVVVVNDGVRTQYNEYIKLKRKRFFLVGAVKNTTLQIRKDKKSADEVALTFDPETSNPQMKYKIDLDENANQSVTNREFQASLNAPKLGIKQVPVTCQEIKWNE